MTIFVTSQLRVTLDSIRNSCDVLHTVWWMFGMVNVWGKQKIGNNFLQKLAIYFLQRGGGKGWLQTVQRMSKKSSSFVRQGFSNSSFIITLLPLYHLPIYIILISYLCCAGTMGAAWHAWCGYCRSLRPRPRLSIVPSLVLTTTLEVFHPKTSWILV